MVKPGSNGQKRDAGVDYRALNAVTKADTFPLPRIDDLLDQLGNASGYWLSQSSREKTAFAVRYLSSK